MFPQAQILTRHPEVPAHQTTALATCKKARGPRRMHGPVLATQNRLENAMTAFNAVRFKIKPGREQEFLDAHRKIHAEWPGLRHVNMTRERCGSPSRPRAG
jgi:hypothetical protein